MHHRVSDLGSDLPLSPRQAMARIFVPLPAEVTPQSALITLIEAKEKVDEILERRIYVNKALVDGYATLIPASIFVAGVQGQVVASSQIAGSGTISVAANWFAFNGLVLDILGTAFGSMRLLSLQRSTRGAERNKRHVKNAFEIFEGEINTMKACLGGRNLTAQEIKRLQAALKTYVEMMAGIHSAYQSSFPSLLDFTPVAFIVARGVINWAMNKSPSIRGRVEGVTWLNNFVTTQRRPRSTIPDQVPIVVMAVGIVFLLISVILRAVSTQFRRVWLGCIIITGIVCLYASPGIMHTDGGHQKCQEKKTKNQIKTLQCTLGIKVDDKDKSIDQDDKSTHQGSLDCV